MNQPRLLEFFEVLGDISFQPFAGSVELFAQGIDQILKGRAPLV